MSRATAQAGEQSTDSMAVVRKQRQLAQFAELNGLTLSRGRMLQSRAPLRLTLDADLLRQGGPRVEGVADTMPVALSVPALHGTFCPMPVLVRDSAAVPPMPASVPSAPVPGGGRLMGCVNPLGPMR